MKKPEDFNILIVDDEPGIRSTLASYIELEGYNVFTASSGNEALKFLDDGVVVHFVITDIRMPDGDGHELLLKIRAKNPIMPVVLMITGFAEISKEQALKDGAIDLLPKPLDIERIEQYLESELLHSH